MGLGGESGSGEPESASDSAEPESIAYPLPELGSFYEALDALSRGTREKPVRIMWMGDSHTAADFMTDEIRQALHRVGRAGGPGFVRLGLDGYRHGEVRLKVSGRWRKAPILPAQRTRVLDGVFGYGGIRTIPLAGASVRAQLGSKYEGDVRWTLIYRLPPGASLLAQIGEQSYVLNDADSASATPPISYRTFEADGQQELVLSHRSGSPEVFGAYVETARPGIVFDTVGINGARAATALAWEPQQFSEAVLARQIDLLVLAYGTNEVFARTNPERYREHTEQIVRLLRQQQRDLPCWVVGPPDAATDDGRSRTRVLQVTEAQEAAAKTMGCAFSSAYRLMGGEGSFSRWMRKHPPLARSDHIHLTIAGYHELGQRLAAVLLGEGGPIEDVDFGQAAVAPRRQRFLAWLFD